MQPFIYPHFEQASPPDSRQRINSGTSEAQSKIYMFKKHVHVQNPEFALILIGYTTYVLGNTRLNYVNNVNRVLL
jgi:hypothetical protein